MVAVTAFPSEFDDRSIALPIATKTTYPTAIPRIQPARKAVAVLPARGVSNIRIVAMIGIGLIATPIARGSTSPMAVPMTG
ncbi:hypothetical protein RE9414_18770 [Prescottella equi]|nr:hypothetical protein RE9414_18770 [Prescottella equi]